MKQEIEKQPLEIERQININELKNLKNPSLSPNKRLRKLIQPKEKIFVDEKNSQKTLQKCDSTSFEFQIPCFD